MALNPGTVNGTSSDPRTVEQNATLTSLIHNADGTISSQYAGSLLYPDGTLTRDYSVLVKPPLRVAEINAVLAAGSDPAKPSGGYILALNVDGVPISYLGLGSPPGTSAAPVIPSAAPLPSIVSSTVKLSDIVKLSSSAIERQYVKGTMKAIDSQVIQATNTANNVSVQVSFAPQAGVTFTPSTFLLAPNGTQTTTVTFDLATIDSLAEGFTTYNIPIALSSPTAILPTPAPLSTPPAPPPPPVVAVPVVPVFTPEPPPPQPPVVQFVAPSPGTWTLVQTAPGNTKTETIITLHVPDQGETAQIENNFVAGIYNSTYGYTRTTVTGPTYGYKLTGDANSAGPQPTPPAPSVTVTEDTNKYQLLTNVFTGPLPNSTITPPLPSPPAKPPTTINFSLPTFTPQPAGQAGQGGGGSGPLTSLDGTTLNGLNQNLVE